MYDEIGETAGEVWRFLDEEGETSLRQIDKNVDAPRSKVCMAIGWLAREGKLDFDTKGRGATFSLG
ncbi:MAG: winged helix-turn-helix domain-containing protein [Candidatus Nanohaloarchaea archaeon]